MLDKYNILFVSPHVDNYGAERSLCLLMKSLKEKGHDVLLVIPQNGKIEELLQDANVPYVIEKYYTWINVGQGTRLGYGAGKFCYNALACRKICKKLKQRGFRPDIIHTNVIITELGQQLAKKLKAKHVWHIREFGQEDFRMSFDFGEKITSLFFKKADAFVAVSKAVMQKYQQFIPENKLRYIYNGVEKKEYKKHHTGDVFRMIMVGRLSEEKGQMEAIKAVDYLVKNGTSSIHLDLYGNGVDEELLKKTVQEYKLDEHISFMGYSNAIDYSIYDVGLVCSRCEAFGRVTAEYMMESLPVIGADSGGTKELIKPEVGLVYHVGNHLDLAKAILELKEAPEKCDEMGKEANAYATDNFTYENYCSRIADLYDELMRGTDKV